MELSNGFDGLRSDGSYRAIFFDLDGTLLPMELEDFLGPYFKGIAKHMAMKGIDPERFSAALMEGTREMMKHPSGITNACAFWDCFYRTFDRDERDWEALFLEFYEGAFREIGAHVTPDPNVKRLIDALSQKGYPLLLTTTPLFPETAVRTRASWAGIDASVFSRITHFENSQSAKPRPSYYAQNLAACDLRGEDVLMVGNNTIEDGVAHLMGADVALVVDHLIENEGAPVDDFPHGTMAEFAAWVEALPSCKNPAGCIEEGVVDEARVKAILDAAGQSDEAFISYSAGGLI